YWFYVIVFFGPLGALAYFVIEVIPDLRIKPPFIARFERKRRRQWLEHVVEESPTVANMQELGEISALEGDHPRAIELFTKALTRDAESREALYGRAKSLVEMGDFARAIADLERVVRREPN